MTAPRDESGLGLNFGTYEEARTWIGRSTTTTFGEVPVSEAMIRKVRKHTRAPLIVGGGIRRPEQAWAGAQAGADVIVVGNAVEKSASLLTEMASAVHGCGADPFKTNGY